VCVGIALGVALAAVGKNRGVTTGDRTVIEPEHGRYGLERAAGMEMLVVAAVAFRHQGALREQRSRAKLGR
jgi:hypothetical protein